MKIVIILLRSQGCVEAYSVTSMEYLAVRTDIPLPCVS